MRTEQIKGHDIELAGVRVPNSSSWTAHLTIYGRGTNPMHRNSVFPYQQVCVETVFNSEQAAEEAALKVAMEML
ncbi:hypothetical protein [Undibacterium terreum]|uniref:Uncharacterized protein n=1 Tax=Undibacterium terreum TaxID=1224302 RepID=A0A916V0I8_9BURK|nr:hypothetical protein [Undibacterium terreum]GGC98870.1 hypothetical protein GCM10011396_53000 [Undibacterium terreum]